MKFLDKFWKGDIAPGEGRYHPDKEYAKAIQTMERSSDKAIVAHYSGLFDKLYQELELRVK